MTQEDISDDDDIPANLATTRYSTHTASEREAWDLVEKQQEELKKMKEELERREREMEERQKAHRQVLRQLDERQDEGHQAMADDVAQEAMKQKKRPQKKRTKPGKVSYTRGPRTIQTPILTNGTLFLCHRASRAGNGGQTIHPAVDQVGLL